jgi:hypothetical protein
VIDIDDLDLGAAEIRQAGGGGERQPRQLWMRIVDDPDCELDGVLGGGAGARGIAGERIDRADLDGIGGRGGDCGHRGKQRGRQNARHLHANPPNLSDIPIAVLDVQSVGHVRFAVGCRQSSRRPNHL